MLPSFGVESVLPLRSFALLIVGLTTSDAPPEVAPDTILMAWPLDFWNRLMAGPEPM